MSQDVLNQLKSIFDSVKKEQEEVLFQHSERLEAGFLRLLQPVFAKHPWVEKVTWRQCEPWRDGEETEFEVLADYDEINLNDLNYYDDDYEESGRDAFKEFSKAILSVPAEQMEMIFGDSSEITITKSGDIEVMSYES